MTKIKNTEAYPYKVPVSNDFVTGTNSETENKDTVSFKFQDIVGLINSINGNEIISYVFAESPIGELDKNGYGYFLSENNETNPANVTKIIVSKTIKAGIDLSELFNFIKDNNDSFVLKLRNTSDPNNFSYFNITNVTEQTYQFTFYLNEYQTDFFEGNLEVAKTYAFDFDIKYASDSGSKIEFQTEITDVSTVFDSSKKGDDALYPFKNNANQTLQINSGVYAVNDVINIERRGPGELEILQGAGVRFRGVRDINNRFFVGDPNTMISLMCRGGDIFSIIGNLKRGGAAVTTSFYDDLVFNDVNKSITVNGTGFSQNMIVTVTGNAIQSSPFTYISVNQIILHLTSTGSAGSFVNVIYDNGEIFEDNNAIILLSSALVYVYTNNPFSFGYALFKLKNTQKFGIQVRRDSDNATTDVRFDSAGKISLSSLVTEGITLSAWAGSANGFITIKYNQGSMGGTYNLVQTDPTKQAKFLNAGALIIQGGRTFSEFDGVNDAYSTVGKDSWCSGNLNIFADVRSKTLVNGLICGYFPGSPRSNERMLQYRFESTGMINVFACNETGSSITVTSTTALVNTNYTTVYSRNATNQLVYLNGTSGTAAAALATYPSESRAIEHGALIDDSSSIFLNGYNNYLILFKIDNRASISAIQSIINNFL